MTMDLSEALTQTRSRIGVRCGTAKALDALNDQQRADVDKAMGDDSITDAHLSRALTLMSGVKVGHHSVKHHRGGGCQCS